MRITTNMGLALGMAQRRVSRVFDRVVVVIRRS